MSDGTFVNALVEHLQMRREPEQLYRDSATGIETWFDFATGKRFERIPTVRERVTAHDLESFLFEASRLKAGLIYVTPLDMVALPAKPENGCDRVKFPLSRSTRYLQTIVNTAMDQAAFHRHCMIGNYPPEFLAVGNAVSKFSFSHTAVVEGELSRQSRSMTSTAKQAAGQHGEDLPEQVLCTDVRVYQDLGMEPITVDIPVRLEIDFDSKRFATFISEHDLEAVRATTLAKMLGMMRRMVPESVTVVSGESQGII